MSQRQLRFWLWKDRYYGDLTEAQDDYFHGYLGNTTNVKPYQICADRLRSLHRDSALDHHVQWQPGRVLLLLGRPSG